MQVIANILFVCGGAFVGLDKILKTRTENHNLGFSKTAESKILDNCILPQDLVKFGLIPEFVGRLPVVSQLQKLSADDLKLILTKPKNALIKQFKEIMNLDGVKFSVSESALDEISKEAIKLSDGARGLRTILENTMLDTMYQLPNDKIKSVTLTMQDKKLKCVCSQIESNQNLSATTVL